MHSIASNHRDTNSSIFPNRFVESKEPTILSEIYKDRLNIVAWRRKLAPELLHIVKELVMSRRSYQRSITLSPNDAFNRIHKALGDSDATAPLSEDIAELVDMFCCLFDLNKVGLRLTALDKAMCPKFHVDRVPCRLVTTYQGEGTEWLPHHKVDRSKLGHGSQGKPDEKSGLFSSKNDVQQLKVGDVALIKGELWAGNEGAGLVHRSPALSTGEQRLLLTLDIV